MALLRGCRNVDPFAKLRFGTPDERRSRMFLVDSLSRAHLSSGAQIESEIETINMMNSLPISEARLLQIQRETEQDESLQVLKAVFQHGGP